MESLDILIIGNLKIIVYNNR